MIILQANNELKNTYEKLIHTMGERVKWNGRFVVIDNYLILQGEVRSLFFNFENRKVVSNIIELPIQPEQILKIEDYPKLQNIINMILYAFGKWGAIKGIKVEQDYQQLNYIFSGILREYHIEPGYTKENYRFFKEGIRLTYEEMVQIVIEAADKPADEEVAEEEQEQSLWHKLIWKKQTRKFAKADTTLEERQQERLGHNFYLVGYLCPECGEKLHMVVYPVGKEQKVETEEGSVYLARAYACDNCNCFYTPRPHHLLKEGSIYEMDFGGDRVAYEDYLELIGENGDRVSNYNYNEYAVEHDREKKQEERRECGDNENEEFRNADEAWVQMEALCRRLRDMPERELDRFLARIEEGFYPDILLKDHERQIQHFLEQRREQKEHEADSGRAPEQKTSVEREQHVEDAERAQKSSQSGTEKAILANKKHAEPAPHIAAYKTEKPEKIRSGIQMHKEEKLQREREEKLAALERETVQAGEEIFENNHESVEKVEQFRKRLSIWDRLSERQRRELKDQIQKEKQITDQTRHYLLSEIKKAEEQERFAQLHEKVKAAEGKNYAVIHRVLEEVEQADVEEEKKQPLLSKLRHWLAEAGEQEVAGLVEQMSPHMERKQFKTFMKKIRSYEDVDLAPYGKELALRREEAEGQEAANMVKRARKQTRSDLTDLMKRMEEADFEPETMAPYLEDLTAKLEEIDQKAIDEICGDVLHKDFDETADAYEQIADGDFLPELKTNALEMLSKRLAKIKTDECESLVRKFQDDLAGKIQENERHHFYPARRVLMKTAKPEETAVIDYALGTYAGNRGLFEYPILVVDTSRSQSGKEGMILTPEHIFVSTLLNAYYAPIQSIKSVKSSTGLLNRGIWLEQKNGAKLKIPYAVGNDEIKKWAQVLAEFIRYLQEKPESRKLEYLAKEKHDTICCFRCGHVYKGGSVCPECGYKNNK